MRSVLPPVELNPGPGGLNGTVAQVLYMFGKLPLPVDWKALDRRLGGKTNQQVWDRCGHWLELLRNGLNLKVVAVDDTKKLLGLDGYKLMRQKFATNPRMLELYSTPTKFMVWQRATREYIEKCSKLPGKIKVVDKVPSVDDLVQLLKEASVVLMTMSGREPSLRLVYGVTGSEVFKVYVPCKKDKTLRVVSKTEMDRDMLHYEQLIGVSS